MPDKKKSGHRLISKLLNTLVCLTALTDSMFYLLINPVGLTRELTDTDLENRKKNSLKIGVLTFHRCINYGSYWQTRCLVKGLQARGHDVVVLDHQSTRVNFAEWKCALQPVLPTAVPKSDRPLYRQKIEKFLPIFNTLPLSAPFPLENPNEMEEYDLVVVGSDEVWNLTHPWYGNCPIFYGDGVKARHLISYAASFGNYDASWGIGQDWAAKLSRFENISVRDENSGTIIKNALGFEPRMVLDPCLQFPIEVADERNDTESSYIALYGHNFSEKFAGEVRQYADKRNLPLISIGYRNDWADEQWLTADPFDFVHFIANAEAVATNFFHGCVFALRNCRPFVCETTSYRSHKVSGLMSQIGGEKHLVTERTPSGVFYSRLTEPLDEEIIGKIERLRQISHSYLDHALGAETFKYA
jgi:hypothetical protein